MAGSDDHGEPVMADDPAAQPGGLVRALGEPDVRRAFGDLGDDRLGVALGQNDIGGGAPRALGGRAEGRQPGRQEQLGDGGTGADPQQAAPVLAQRRYPGV